MTEDHSSNVPLGESDQDRCRAHFEAAEALTWGGPLPSTAAGKPLPSTWTDVTDVVLEALGKVRSDQAANGDSP